MFVNTRCFLLVTAIFSIYLSTIPVHAESSFETALELALTYHPAIAGKREELNATLFVIQRAKSLSYPSLSAQAQYGIGRNDNSSPVNIRIKQPVWTFGRIKSEIRFAEAQTALERVDLFRVKRNLVEQTAIAYANVLGIKRKLEVSRQSLASYHKFLNQIKRRAEGKLASRSDVKLANNRLAQAESRHKFLASELDIAMNDLQSLTQRPVGTFSEIPNKRLDLPSENEILTLAQKNSVEIKLQLQEVSVSKANVDQIRTSSMPTLYLQVDQDINQPGYGDDTRAGVVFEGNFEGLGFIRSNNIQNAQAQFRAATKALLNIKNDIKTLSLQLMRQRQVQQSLSESLNDSVTELQALLNSFQRQYELGTKSWLDVMNMQRELTENELQYAQAQHDYIYYSLQLKVLTGGFDDLLQEDKNE